jgi:site-specific recombinase XerD
MRTGTLIHYVKKYLRLTGLPTDGLGTHLFRYSCAQRLLEAETSLKLIGDYLGHRDLTTTQRYLKIDVEHLREVALNLPENAA